KEFDLDGAISRKPALILLDELAHTNAPGCRHPKRWQDVEELLDEGIDVYTTLNVQHLESLNDLVARITGIWVKETVPDALVDRADDIALIDIPPDELLKRLSEGKVYISEQIQKRAATNFFRKGNLIALREMALRRTAERVDAQMTQYTVETGTKEVTGTGEKILVCIGADALSLKLVRATKRMANRLKVEWSALYVESDKHYRLSSKGLTAVERTLRLAEEMGGDTHIVQSASVAEAIISHAEKFNISRIIVGKKDRAAWRDIFQGNLVQELIRRSGAIDVFVISGDAENEKPLIRTERLKLSVSPLLQGIGAITAATLIGLPFRPFLDPSVIIVLYMLATLLVAVRSSVLEVGFTTFLAVVSFDFMFQKPYYQLYLSNDWPNFLILAGLLGAALFMSRQATRLRLQATYSIAREKNTASLYAMTRALSANRGIETLAKVATQHISDALVGQVSVWLPSADGTLAPLMPQAPESDNAAPASLPESKEESAARWAFQHQQNAGRGTSTLPTAKGLYVPLNSPGGVLGVVGVSPKSGEDYSSEQVDLLETFTSQTASALERAMIADMAEKTALTAETEKLRNLLLSSVSHDLRAPVAAITAASSSLMMDTSHARLNEQAKDDLMRLIHTESVKISKIVTNLLDVTSLESGAIKLSREYFFIEELIGSALLRTKETLGSWPVEVNIAEFIPLVYVDGLLLEQVFVTLLEHAGAQGDERYVLRIKADITADVLEVCFGYRPDGQRPSLAEEAAEMAEKPRGTSLGLGICRGIVTAHTGQMNVKQGEDEYVTVQLLLPLKEGAAG
ncbi:MAG: DUF4118 domain-containing protein, partial [Holosporales bacterium]